MQIGQAQVVRNNWYDRSPIPVLDNYQSNLAPHTNTTRVSYTVPVSRTLQLSSFIASYNRLAAATTAGEAYAYLAIYDDSAVLVDEFKLAKYIEAVGIPYISTVDVNMLIPAGYEVRLSTFDNSSAGTVSVCVGITGTLFDA